MPIPTLTSGHVLVCGRLRAQQLPEYSIQSYRAVDWPASQM